MQEGNTRSRCVEVSMAQEWAVEGQHDSCLSLGPFRVNVRTFLELYGTQIQLTDPAVQGWTVTVSHGGERCQMLVYQESVTDVPPVCDQCRIIGEPCHLPIAANALLTLSQSMLGLMVLLFICFQLCQACGPPSDLVQPCRMAAAPCMYQPVPLHHLASLRRAAADEQRQGIQCCREGGRFGRRLHSCCHSL